MNVPLGLGHRDIVCLPHDTTFELNESALAFQQPAFDTHRRTDRQRLAIADIRTRRETTFALQPQPVRHHVVEQTEDDAAVRQPLVTHVRVARRELGAADVAIDPKLEMQSDRVRGAANETTVGW